MSRGIEQFEPLGIVNPSKAWVVKELDKLLAEWTAWNEVVQTLGDSPDHDPQTCSEAIKDGWDSLRKHGLLP